MAERLLSRLALSAPHALRYAGELLTRSAKSWRNDPARLPVFIVGSGRCGTTLLGIILDSHPGLAITPETQFLPRAVKDTLRAPGRPAMVEALFRFPRVPEIGVSPEEVLDAFEKSGLATPSNLLESYYECYAAKEGKPRWGDNTPNYCECMPLIEKLFGGAAFVHLIRDGRDVATSLMPLDWGPDTPAEAARFWQDKITRTRTVGASLKHYHEMRFEDLLTSPEQELRRLCDFLHLPFDPAILDYQEAGKRRIGQMQATVGEMSSEARRATQERITSNFDPTRIARWKTDMPPEARAEFESIAGGLLSECGYEVE